MADYSKLEEHYVKHRKAMLKLLSRRAGSIDNAEDIIQESFTRAMEHWDSYDHSRPLTGWLQGILYNAMSDFKAEEIRQGMKMQEEEFVNVEEEVVLSHEQKKLLEDIRGRLNEKNRPSNDVLYLYFILGYTPREIRRVLNLPTKTIRQIVWRFKKEVTDEYRTKLGASTGHDRSD